MTFQYPELELAVCCCRMEPDAATVGRIREILQNGVDWKVVFDVVDRHRLTLLVYKRLLAVAPEALTQPGANVITEKARAVAARNLRLTAELLSLLGEFERQGISAIPIKGPILAQFAFGNLGWREFEDLDVLVRPTDIHRVMDLLTTMGYRPERVLLPGQEAAFMRSEHAFRFLRDHDQLVVELHWRLQDRYLSFAFDLDDLWKRASRIEAFGRKVLWLSAEDTLLFLCMHGAKHYWERLEWIACLPALIRSNPIQWQLVMNHASRLGGVRIVQLGLLLAHDVDPASETEDMLLRLDVQPIARELAARVWNAMGEEEMTGSRKEVYRFRFYLKARERLWDRLYVVAFASIRIPHPDCSIWQELVLPRSLLFLHYFISPVRLFRKYGLQGLRGIVRPTRIP